ncbi:hypothetical protein APR08_004803 [Nocardia amikacinitolerans]|nr:hypothetical protein [Nocardia amikacinitolerans]
MRDVGLPDAAREPRNDIVVDPVEPNPFPAIELRGLKDDGLLVPELPAVEQIENLVALGWMGSPVGREALLSIGEAKWNDTMGLGHLDRLRRIRDLLSAKFDTSRTRLACYSGADFMPALTEAAAAEDVVLVDSNTLYGM